MRNWLRDFFRRRRVKRHLARNGPVFDYHGLTVNVPPEAGLSALNALIRGKYERDEAHLIAALLPRDLPVIELGGSLGVVSKLIRSRLAPDTPHLVVEANADLVAICAANIASPASRVINAALWHGGPVARFRIGDEVHANALDGGGGNGGRVRDVPAVTLASLLAALGDPPACVLVSDIEGAEYALFDKEQAALARVRLAIVEIHPERFAASGGSEAGFLELVAAAGFRIAERRADVLALVR